MPTELRVSVDAVTDTLDEYDETGDSWEDDEVREAFIGVQSDVRRVVEALVDLYS